MAEKKAPIPANNMSMPLTPPPSPVVLAAGATGATPGSVPESTDAALPSRVVLLYVGRVSWEKNLVLLLRAYGRMGAFLPAGTPLPKLVFVGDGPARTELESICEQEGYDATFMGHRSGEELAACYASADVFAFPSFTETFGQVVLEALASGLPVIGLDAQGTRDLVSHGSTGLLLPLPKGKDGTSTWPAVCCPSHTLFPATVEVYAALLARVASNPAERAGMGGRACTDGIRGFTWWDAMERCVDGYREAVGRARSTRAAAHAERLEAELAAASSGSEGSARTAAPSSSPRISRVNRALSARLAKRPDAAAFQLTPSKSTLTSASHRRRGGSSARKSYDPAETLWHLKNVAKVVLVAIVFWAIFARHLESKGRVMGWAEVWFRPKLEASSS
jgi:hypothetical protein